MASACFESQPSSSDAKTSLTNFFSNPQNPSRTLPVHDVIHIPWLHFLSWVSIVTSLNDTSSPCVREHVRSCLHLTNPCAKRKVLSLTKLKGKIYKTKSLGHYNTQPVQEGKKLLISNPLYLTLNCVTSDPWCGSWIKCIHKKWCRKNNRFFTSFYLILCHWQDMIQM